MRFFKYLIFVLFSFLSLNAFAATGYQLWGREGVYPTKEAACASAASSSQKSEVEGSTCWILSRSSDGSYYRSAYISINETYYEPTCPDPGYPINVIQKASDPIVKVMCVPLAGTDKYCVANKNNYPIINISNTSGDGVDRISYSVSNVSKTPVSNCTPLNEGQCNNKDPYGGCFKVPDDGCTRTQNGSIICPNNDTPNVQNNCTGTYCERPPTGCPTGYVSGSFNGKALCVKSSPSNGSGNGNGSGSGDGDGSGNGNGSGSGDGDGSGNGNGSGSGSGSNSSTSSSTSTSTSTSTSSNGSGGSTTVNVTNNNTNNTTVNVDVSGVISAINNMKSTLADFLNDVNKSVKEVTSTLNNTNQKIDTTNQKLDTTNNTLSQINQNGKDTNNKLDQLINKQGGENNGNGTDLTATNQKIDELNKTAKESKGLIQDIKDWLTTPPDQAQLDGLNGELPQKEIQRSELKTNIFSSSAQCPPDSTLVMPMLGTYTFSFSEWCYYLQIAGYFILIGAYLFAAYIVSKA